MTAAGWRAALRIARRDSWRAKGRSLLVIGLIGLPVLLLGILDIAYRTYQLSPHEQLTREIGAAEAGIEWGGGPVEQQPSGYLGDWSSQGSDQATGVPATASLLSALPAGSRVIEMRQSPGGAEVRTPDGIAYVSLIGFDYADPIAHGMVRQVNGRAPATTHEAAITSTLAGSAGLGVGDVMHLVNPNRDFTIVGIVADRGHRHAEKIYTQSAAIPVAANEFSAPMTWLVATPAHLDWQAVLQLNKVGYVVLSRAVYLDPPPRSQVPYDTSHRSISTEAAAIATLIVGMALLEVVLLAGPAFAVGTRRQRRDLALVASVGGRRGDLRNIVLANGIVLGLGAGVAGIGLALAGMGIGIPTLGRQFDSVPGAFDVRPLELGGLVLLAVLTALAAAAFPARAAGRTDVVAALAGRRGTVRTPKRVVVLGLVLAAAGIVVALGGVTGSTGPSVILTGIALTELGLIICTPGILGLTSRLGRRLPLAPRIALRDAGRNRSAAAPAVAAVMASVIGAIAILLTVASSDDQSKRGYEPSFPHRDAWVALPTGSGGDAQQVAAALRSTLATDEVTIVRGTSSECRTLPCSFTQVDVAIPAERASNTRIGSRYHGGPLPSAIVDDGSHLNALFGAAVPGAAAALRAGKAIVPDTNTLRDGMITVEVGTVTVDGRKDQSGGGTVKVARPALSQPREATIPAVVEPGGLAPAQVILPPAVARQLNIPAVPAGVLVTLHHTPTRGQQHAVNAAVAAIDPLLRVDLERGYRNPNQWQLYALVGVAAMIAIGAAVIATALANADGRADLVTLGAVGASPRTRRVLSSTRAGVIAGIGSVLGTAAGFLPATAWIHSVHRRTFHGSGFGPALRLVVPWGPLLIALVGIPLLAALLCGVFSRSGLPVERHAE